MQTWDALTPLDGRYREQVRDLADYLSEGALIRYRARIEILWLRHLFRWQQKGVLKLPVMLSSPQRSFLERCLKEEITEEHPLVSIVEQVKNIEAVTAHDVKAVELALRRILNENGFDPETTSFLHFLCTSEDINNLSYGLMLKDATEQVLLPQLDSVLDKLRNFAQEHAGLAMIARTHGQKATPTSLGKEFAIFTSRLQKIRAALAQLQHTGKFNGAVGNYNAHVFVLPDAPWEEIARDFVEHNVGLPFNPLTTQIEPHDSIVNLCHLLSHMGAISIDVCRDIWGYIALGYFKLTTKKEEVGSSTMPHKVNPIDFENAEGNFGLAIALAQHLAVKLPVSRWQRDLSDSTVMRSLATLFGHCYLALRSLDKGLAKLSPDAETIAADLNESWEVLGEALQSALRLSGTPDAYEKVKSLTRGQQMSQKDWQRTVREMRELSEPLQERLLKLSPRTYLGLAEKLGKSC
ncbi:MAG: adenylosuccinate lyase [Deltaproteobacteria bacterium]|nr:adenylosuccinate lyase [Deltaproteobacteria bacterium]